MKILILGASGLIGTAVAARLGADGHEVVGLARAPHPGTTGFAGWISMDISRALAIEDWSPHLASVECIVNCAGALQDGPTETVAGVHAEGIGALYAACEGLGNCRVIHFSAVGVDRHQASAFSASKNRGDSFLMARDIDWIILRPSVVLGRAVFGASALLRGLAALPVLPVMPATGALRVVMLEDVVETVARLVGPGAPSRVQIDLAGPEDHTMTSLAQAYRAWLGWRPARLLALPAWAAEILYRLGDLAGWLGWRPPLRSTARLEIAHGATGDARAWIEATGIAPRALADQLRANPPAVQDRWFARLYFLKPLLFVILAAFWIGTGIISLTIGWEIGLDLLRRAGIPQLAAPGVILGALADILVGCAIAYRPTAKRGLWSAIALSSFYIVTGTILLPELWNEPLGPLFKIWPILVAHLMALAILKER